MVTECYIRNTEDKLVKLAVNDYIVGYEDSGKCTKGWVNEIYTEIKSNSTYICCEIQADDGYKGHRGTTVSTEYGDMVKLDLKERPTLTNSYSMSDEFKG